VTLREAEKQSCLGQGEADAPAPPVECPGTRQGFKQVFSVVSLNPRGSEESLYKADSGMLKVITCSEPYSRPKSNLSWHCVR
jgi:hypothetical protein